jgi:tRNA uridine 5-carboxymethylaminomethyl modification enzyme
LMAGINAALKVKNEPPLILDRTDGYTAILIDDLISKGTNEPYRMFTSRAEFRLHLRIDNADRRLTPFGRRIGLISDAAWADFLAKQERLEKMKTSLERTKLTGAMLESIQHAALSLQTVAADDSEEPNSHESSTASDQRPTADFTSALGQPLAQMLKRPEIRIEYLAESLRQVAPEFFGRQDSASQAPTSLPSEVRNELKSVETEIKYEGYLQQQNRAIERLKKSEQRNIPDWFDYWSISGLSREMQEKLSKIKPRTIGHASRIPGVTPAAVSLVNVYIEIQAKRRDQAAAI